MTKDVDRKAEFRHYLSVLGLSQTEYAELTGTELRTVQRWLSERDESPKPPPVAIHDLKLLIKLRESEHDAAANRRSIAKEIREIAAKLHDLADRISK